MFEVVFLIFFSMAECSLRDSFVCVFSFGFCWKFGVFLDLEWGREKLLGMKEKWAENL